MENENLSAEGFYKTLLIIWFALFMSQFMFIFVIFMVKPEIFNYETIPPLLGENAPIVIAFLFIAIVNLFISIFLKKKYLNDAIEKQSVGLVQTAMIVGCALCESISLFGFVLAFAFDYKYFFIWFVIGIIGMLTHFPRRENLHLATYKKSQQNQM